MLNRELLFLRSTPWGRCSGHCYHPHFTGEQTEAQRRQITLPGPYSWQGAGLKLGDGWTLSPGLRGAHHLLPGMWSFAALT